VEVPKKLNKVVGSVKQAATAKSIISAASVGMLIPLAKLIYWVFDTAYLGGFGVSPDIYSRPIFSSGFVSTWLVVESLGIMIVGWSILAFVLFIILTAVNVKPNRDFLTNEEEDNKRGAIVSEDFSLKEKIFNFFDRILESVSHSLDWPVIIWSSGLSIFLLLAFAMIWASEKGNKLANEQRDLYLNNGICADKFNSSNSGCFKITGIKGKDHFIIANSKTHLIYLSRESGCNDDSSQICKSGIKLNILEKAPGSQYSVVRDFVPFDDNEASLSAVKVSENNKRNSD